MNSTNSIDTADYIALSNIDANGKEINLDRVVENDVIRMGSLEGGSAELRVTDATGGLYKFDRISGDLNRLAEVPHDFVLLSSFDPAGLATIEYVDVQDATKIGKSGNQILEAGEWRIKQPRSSGGTGSFIVINDNVMNLYHVAYPENGEHAANMQYVDDKVEATEQYVDDQIAAIPAPSAGSPAPLLWKYNASATADNLSNGEFTLSAGLESDQIGISILLTGMPEVRCGSPAIAVTLTRMRLATKWQPSGTGMLSVATAKRRNGISMRGQAIPSS